MAKENKLTYSFLLRMPADYELLIKDALLREQKITGKRKNINEWILDAVTTQLLKTN